MPDRYARTRDIVETYGTIDWFRGQLTPNEYRGMMQSIDDLPIPGREEYRKERIAERKAVARQTEGRKFRY